MNDPDAAPASGEGASDLSVPPPSWSTRWVSRAEVWIYELNEADHWIFRLYDWGNEQWAHLAFRGVRERALALDERIEGKGVVGRLRMLTPADLDAFAQLLEALAAHKYLPPHPLDRESARSALGRRSYLPFGLFDGDRLVGYWLLRLFFPKRSATGVWMLRDYFDSGLGTLGVAVTGAFTDREGLHDYITAPLDNVASLRGAVAAGWRVLRKNERFYVLLRGPATGAPRKPGAS